MDRSTFRHDHAFQSETYSDGSVLYLCLHCGIMRTMRPAATEMAETPEELRMKMEQAREELAADLAALRG